MIRMATPLSSGSPRNLSEPIVAGGAQLCVQADPREVTSLEQDIVGCGPLDAALGMQMPTLRARKVIYTVLVIGAGAVWLPYIVLGLVVGIGALGLLCVLSLLRCIWVLPVESRFSRGFYSVAIHPGHHHVRLPGLPCGMGGAFNARPLVIAGVRGAPADDRFNRPSGSACLARLIIR
jgi:hypothetical protein